MMFRFGKDWIMVEEQEIGRYDDGGEVMSPFASISKAIETGWRSLS